MLEQFVKFQVLDRVGMLQPDIWIIHSFVPRKDGSYYRVTLVHSLDRPIGIVTEKDLEYGISTGRITVLDKMSVKKKKKRVDKSNRA